MKKILYLSCHSILEYDELKLFNELGYEFFSMGSYLNPNKPSDNKRPPIKAPYNDHYISLANRYTKDFMCPQLIKPFDVIVVMHIKDWIVNNWHLFEGKKVVWRSIGQSTSSIEKDIKFYKERGLKIVRYSQMEDNIPGWAGYDDIIHFYKDPEEFKDWNGDIPQVICVNQFMKTRGEWCGWSKFEAATKDFQTKLFGPGNEDSGYAGGLLTYDEMKEQMRNSRVFFYTGTYPAPYTLGFIEALMTGIPVVAIGPSLANIGVVDGLALYQIGKFIKNGVNGFISNDIEELRKSIRRLLEDKTYAYKIGQEGRKTAIELFGKERIKEQWRNFFNTI